MMPMPPNNQSQPPAGPAGDPQMIKQKLIELLTQAKKMAEQNGINFNEILSAISGGGVQAPPPPPRR